MVHLELHVDHKWVRFPQMVAHKCGIALIRDNLQNECKGKLWNVDEQLHVCQDIQYSQVSRAEVIIKSGSE